MTTQGGEPLQLVDPDAARTTSEGYFLVRVKGLPSEFRVEATGGAVAGVPLSATLASTSTNREDFVYINAATTMADAHRRAAGIPHEEAHGVVQRHFGIPGTVSLGAGLFGKNEHFDHRAFFDAAGNGLDAAVTHHVARLGDPASVDSFTPQGETDSVTGSDPLATAPTLADQPPVVGSAGSIALALGESLAKGAVSAVAGDFVGWGLKKLGLSPDDPGQTVVETQLKHIQDTLATQDQSRRAEAAELRSALNQVRESVSELYAEMQDSEEATSKALTSLKNAVEAAQYDSRVQAVLDIRDTVETSSDALHDIFYLADDPANAGVVSAKLQRLADNATALQNKLSVVPCFFGLAGCLGQSNAWNIQVGRVATDPLWTAVDAQAFNAIFGYIQSTYVAQVTAALEYEHAQLSGLSGAGSATLGRLGNDLRTNLPAIARFEPYVPNHGMVDLRNSVEFESLPFEGADLFTAAANASVTQCPGSTSCRPQNILGASYVLSSRLAVAPFGSAVWKAYRQSQLHPRPGARLPTAEEVTSLLTGDEPPERAGMNWVLSQVGACTGECAAAVLSVSKNRPFLTGALVDARPPHPFKGQGCGSYGRACNVPVVVSAAGAREACPTTFQGSFRCAAVAVLVHTLPAGTVLPPWKATS